jgi:hypothetical protein
MPEPVGPEEPSGATSTEGKVDLVQDPRSVEDRREQYTPSEVRVDSENSPLVTPHESLNHEGEYQTNQPTNPPGQFQTRVSGRKFHVLFQTKWHLLLLTFTAALFAGTAWFAQATFSVSSVIDVK